MEVPVHDAGADPDQPVRVVDLHEGVPSGEVDDHATRRGNGFSIQRAASAASDEGHSPSPRPGHQLLDIVPVAGGHGGRRQLHQVGGVRGEPGQRVGVLGDDAGDLGPQGLGGIPGEGHDSREGVGKIGLTPGTSVGALAFRRGRGIEGGRRGRGHGGRGGTNRAQQLLDSERPSDEGRNPQRTGLAVEPGGSTRGQQDDTCCRVRAPARGNEVGPDRLLRFDVEQADRVSRLAERLEHGRALKAGADDAMLM